MLGKLIKALEQADPNKVVRRGFGKPDSYRGYYEDVAFEPVENVTVASMLTHAKSALGKTFDGYKGGEYTMGEYTDCWIAPYGETSKDKIGPMLLSYMLAESAPPEKEPGPRCPKCGSTVLIFGPHSGHIAVLRCETGHETRLQSAADFAQFFPPSPQERWVPDAETLAKKMQELDASKSYRKDQYAAWAKLALEALAVLPDPPAQPLPQASDKEQK